MSVGFCVYYALSGYIELMHFAQICAYPKPLPFVFHVFCGPKGDRSCLDCVSMADAHQLLAVQQAPHLGHVAGGANVFATYSEQFCLVLGRYLARTFSEEGWSAIRLGCIGIVIRWGYCFFNVGLVFNVVGIVTSGERCALRRGLCQDRTFHFS